MIRRVPIPGISTLMPLSPVVAESLATCSFEDGEFVPKPVFPFAFMNKYDFRRPVAGFGPGGMYCIAKIPLAPGFELIRNETPLSAVLSKLKSVPS